MLHIWWECSVIRPYWDMVVDVIAEGGGWASPGIGRIHSPVYVPGHAHQTPKVAYLPHTDSCKPFDSGWKSTAAPTKEAVIRQVSLSGT
ncbi:Hypothetical predicted protein, partial [Pelobates cultripes]